MAPALTRKRRSEQPTGASTKRLRPRAPAASATTNTASRALIDANSSASVASRVSPADSSSVAAEARSVVSADTISEMPSSGSEDGEGHETEASPATFNAPKPFSIPPSIPARLSEHWKAGARAQAQFSKLDLTPDELIARMFRTPTSPPKPVRPFLSLPRELRDQIYRELLVHDKSIALRQPKFHMAVRAEPQKPLALVRTNRQILNEAMAIYVAENSFVLDMNILTSIDFLAAMPASLAVQFSTLTLGKGIMSGYVRYELGMFDSSRLRADLVKRLVYDFDLKSISIEVPDEHNPSAQANGNGAGGHGGGVGAGHAAGNAWFNLSTFHPRHDYSWSLMRELIDVLLVSGFQTLRLIYANPIHHDIDNDPKTLLNLYAVSRILYMDDDFEVETQFKRIEMARLAGRRNEFADKKAVERYVRAGRQMRQFEVGKAKLRGWETGSVVLIRRSGAPKEKGEDKMWDVRELLDMPGGVEGVNTEL